MLYPREHSSNSRTSVLVAGLMLFLSASPLFLHSTSAPSSFLDSEVQSSETGIIDPWTDGDQPWPQAGRTPDRMSIGPAHSSSGGAGIDVPANASELLTVIEPVVNWVYGSYSIGTDALGTPIADLSNQISTESAAAERCGGSSLFTILIQTVNVGGNDHSFMRIIEGEDSSLVWEVDLGATEIVKASPLVVDLDEDGKQEILVVYDAAGSMHVDAWSPSLECSVTGWSSGGNSGDLLWTYSNDELRISSSEGPYTSNLLGGHKPTTQPLLADLDLDGDAELVIAAIDEISGNPVVVALPLSAGSAPTSLWESTLEDGSHPSDPAFAQMDDTTGYVMLTTTEASSGAMWVWKIDSQTGDQKWGGLSLMNLDGDTDVPHIRLPGPVIVNLDDDSTPEMVLTIPTDADGASGVDGAEYRGLEIGDGSELWSFEAVNGFADAPPIVIDTDADGKGDRVCWVTWYQETTARHGKAGCHDISTTNPQLEWHRDLEMSSGLPNDEIAVAPPVWIDIDGNGAPELIVAFGRSLWAFDGDEGTQTGVNNHWNNEVEVEHRTWSAPALADIDGDATLDIIIGDTVISTALADVRPLLDGRSIDFNPSAPDPGESVTVTALFENAGTSTTDRPIDAVLFADGVEIGRHRADSLDPTGPTGNAGFESFSIEWSGPLGEHSFQLVVDPYQNVSQSRYDNDDQMTSLAIIPPYNASFEMPTDPIRIDPGSSALAQPTIRSTGRLAGIWSLSVDDTTLPEGWTWTDETLGGLDGIEIGSDDTWTPDLRIHAPADASGSAAGHLSLTLTLDEDVNVSVTGVLAVEANRTRGLSIRGPSGTTASTGYGLIGESAKAWLIVENLGNADENSIGMNWGGTSWDSSGNNLALHDSGGEEITALTLSAGETKVISARLGVPTDSYLGDSVSTPLTMCVGSDEDETCQTVQLSFVASGVVAEVDHQRSMPENTLQWTVMADLPPSVNSINWSLADAGMTLTGWAWSGSSSLTISGDDVQISGTAGSRTTGTLTLNLPPDSVPAFHTFSDIGSLDANHALRLSVEVLQIHRAGLTLVSPTESPHLVEVDTPSSATVRLYNPGNGQDSYTMTHDILLDENLSEDPGISVTFSADQVSLAAGNLRTLPIEIVLPASTPARTPVKILFTMTSDGDAAVADSVILILEARQDHRWEITSSVDGLEVEGRTFAIQPGSTLLVDVQVKNVGNLQDDLSLGTTQTVTYSGTDSSQGWSAVGDSVDQVAVNGSAWLTITVQIPADAWNGSITDIEVTATAFDEDLLTFSFSVEVTHVASWTAVANNADLEIDPAGSTVSLMIIQQGNAPSRPYVSVHVTGENGWEVIAPEELPTMDPEENTPLDLQITPPASSHHGRTVELHVKLREGDGSGESTITLPLRVAIILDFSLTGESDWVVSDDGGYPLAELENLGNSPTTISLEILSLPQGWIVAGRTEVVLAVGEISGVPLEIIPTDDWDGASQTIRILAQDSAGNQREISLDTTQADHSWASSPVIVAVSGDSALLDIHGTNPSSSVVDDVQNQLEWDIQGGWVWYASSTAVGNQISVDGTSNLPYIAHVIEPANRIASCSISGAAIDILAQCSVFNGTEAFGYTIMLIDDEGDMLDSYEGFVAANTSAAATNLSAEAWNPLPGMRTLTLRLLDSRGVLVTMEQVTFEIRRSDWNVGLVDLEIEGEGAGQKIKVLTKRENQYLLSDANCIISVSAGTHQATHIIDMTGVYAPTPKLDRPSVEDGTEMVVRISCEFPWDEDSDSSDDEVRIILSGGAVDVNDGFEWATGFVAAALVISIALTLAWIVHNQKDRRRLLEMTEAVFRQRPSKVHQETEQSQPPVEPVQTQEESAESTQPVDSHSEERTRSGGPHVSESADEQSAAQTVEDEPSDEFESRLKRLTGSD